MSQLRPVPVVRRLLEAFRANAMSERCVRPRLARHLLLLLLLPALTGCSSIRVHMGLRVELPKIPVAGLESSLQGPPAMAPGEKRGLIVTVAAKNGTTLMTEGAGKGKVLWRDLAVTADVVSVDKKGNVTLPHDPRLTENKVGHITVTVPSQPGLRADLDVPLRYDYPFTSRFFGGPGSSGLDGSNGTDGSPGLPGSIDPDHPSPGGNGGDGTDGTDGSSGGDGDPGPAVEVRVTLRPGSQPVLLQAGVTAPGHKERLYLINPNGGSLTVVSAGGPGGQGGKGGRGGRGGSGGIGTPNGNSGRDGRNGTDGFSGRDGSGGPVHVTYDPEAKPYLAAIAAQSPGGPKPVFTEAPVPPLW